MAQPLPHPCSVVLPALPPETKPVDETLMDKAIVHNEQARPMRWTSEGKLWLSEGWAASVERLRDGTIVTVNCTHATPTTAPQTGGVRRVRRSQDHSLRLHPDGSITLLSHRTDEAPDGEFLDRATFDPKVSLFMRALGDKTDDCRAVAEWLLATDHAPLNRPQIAALFGASPGMHNNWMNYTTLYAYAAVAWAQQPSWPKDAWEKFLSAGITPTTLEAWLADGWTVHQAITLLAAGASATEAREWFKFTDDLRLVGKFARHQMTVLDARPWMAAGFPVDQIPKWAFPARSLNRLTRETMWKWHCAGVTPHTAHDFAAFPVATPPSTTSKNRPVPTQARAVEWTAAGVPAHLVWRWFQGLGDDLETTLRWCRVVSMREYEEVLNSNNAHPERPLTPEDAKRWRKTKVPFSGDLMGRLVRADVDPDRVMAHIDMLVGKRWYGRELREVLIRFAEANEHASRAGAHQRVLSAAASGDWEPVMWNLRAVDGNSALWEPLVEWECTHPEPPRWEPRHVPATHDAS